MEVDESIIPIFIETEIPKKTIQIGTAVFVDFQNKPFLFTAAHVTDDMANGRLLVPTVDGLSEIEGYTAYIDLPPETSRSEDSVDMAYIRLSSVFASKLCFHFKPLPQKKIRLISSALELGVVSVVGYPASKSKKKQDSFQSEMCYYRGVVADSETYSSLELCPTSSTVIHFHKKRIVKPETMENYAPPSPKGVSGGALFAWPHGAELSQDWSIPELVGIFHTYKKQEGVMIGTNLISFVAATTLGEMKGFDGVV